MKYLPNIVGGLLGLLFVFTGATYLLNLAPMPEMPAGQPSALYMGAMVPTGYMGFVKVFETLGGLLVAIPRTRNYGLLVLGPIIINILAYEVFVSGDPVMFPAVLAAVLAVPALYLLWCGRKAFAGLLR